MSEEKMVYELDGTQIEVSNIQIELDKAYNDLIAGKGAAHERAIAEQIDLAALPGSLSELMSFRKSAAGSDPSLIELIVLLASSQMVKTVALDLWKKVLLPLLVAKYGSAAIKQKKSGARTPTKGES